MDKGDDGDEVDVGSFELSLTDDDEQADDAKSDTFEVDIQVLTDSGSNEAASDLDIGVAGLLDQSDPRFASDPKMKEVKSRIMEALRNFNYDTLKVDLIQKDGGLTASVTVNGKGGTGDTAQELDLTVNVNGIDQLLRQALIIKQALGAVGQ